MRWFRLQTVDRTLMNSGRSSTKVSPIAAFCNHFPTSGLAPERGWGVSVNAPTIQPEDPQSSLSASRSRNYRHPSTNREHLQYSNWPGGVPRRSHVDRRLRRSESRYMEYTFLERDPPPLSNARWSEFYPQRPSTVIPTALQPTVGLLPQHRRPDQGGRSSCPSHGNLSRSFGPDKPTVQTPSRGFFTPPMSWRRT